MIIELFGSLAVGVAWGLTEWYRYKDSKQIISNPGPSTDLGKLIVESLRDRDDWNVNTTTDQYHNKQLGLLIGYDANYLSVVNKVAVFVSEANELERVNLPSDDCRLIEAELKAYTARAKDRRQREIARVVAKRVLGQPPTSGSVLGGRGVSSNVSGTEVDQDRRPDPVSPGLLTFDKNSGKVVQIGGSDSGVLMDAELKKRYELHDTDLMKYDPFTHLYITRSKAAGMHRTYKGVPIKYIPPSGED